MFRPFGSTTAPSGTGAFGGQTQSQQAGGFGGFGSATPASNTGLFGGAPSTSAPFGSQPAQPAMAFGQTPTGFSSGSNPRYAVTTDTEGNSSINLQSITAMQAYQRYSFEELRLEDYLAGRKGAVSAPFGAIGTQTAPKPAATGGLFGTPAQPAQSSFSGAFGAQQSGGIFGAQPVAPSAPATTGGLFGSTSGSIFGQQQQQPQQPATSGFGAFGQPSTGATTAGLFGTAQPAAPTSTFSGTPGGLFGTQPAAQQQQTANAFSAFGKPLNTTPAAPSFGAFGQPQQQPQSTGGIFGQAPQQQPPQQPASGLFGQGSSTFNKPAATGGLFGSTPAAPATTTLGGGLFGQQPQQSQPGQTGGLFSTTPSFAAPSTAPATGGFSFGQQQQPAQQPQATSAMPSLGSLNFPSASTPLTIPSMQQQPPQQPQQSTGGSLFSLQNSSSQQPTTGGSFSFGAGASSTQPQTSLFNFSQPAAPAATVVNPALPLVNAESLSIKPPIPAALTTSKDFAPFSGGSKTSSGTTRSPVRASTRTPFRLNPPAESPQNTGAIVTGNGFVLPRPVVTAYSKKLVVNPLSNVPETARFQVRQTLSRVPSSDVFSTPGHHQDAAVFSTPGSGSFGEKFMIPAESTLRKLPYTQLSCVQNFTIGERGIGQIRFLQPVDLTKIPLNDIFEKIVIFEPRLVKVYPEGDFDEETKPSPGTDLNVPAEIRLEKCWPVSKATREPIKDMGDERMRAHIERLKNQEDTKFVDYYPESGTWVFRVEHFSTYGLPESAGAAATAPAGAQDENQMRVAWEDRVLSYARSPALFGGMLRHAPLCWIPDGSGVISRYRVTCLFTILSPRPLSSGSDPEQEIKEILNIAGNIDCSKQDLCKILKESTHKDPLIDAIVKDDYTQVLDHLDRTDRPRLGALAMMIEGKDENVISLMRLQLHQTFMIPQAQRGPEWREEALIMSILASSHTHLMLLELPWRVALICLLKNRDLSDEAAFAIIHDKGFTDSKQDPLYYLLCFKYKIGSMELFVDCLARKTRNWALIHEIVARLNLRIPWINREIICQLVAQGFWSDAVQHGLRNIDLFVRTDPELEYFTPAAQDQYHLHASLIKPVIGERRFLEALANRAAKFGTIDQRMDFLERAGHFKEMTQLLCQKLVDFIIKDDIPGAILMIRSQIHIDSSIDSLCSIITRIGEGKVDLDTKNRILSWKPLSQREVIAKQLLLEKTAYIK